MSQDRDTAIQCDIGPHLGRRLDEVERDLILGTLARCGGNRTWAAEILGISVRTLRNKLVQYDAARQEPARPGRRTRSERDARIAVLNGFDPGRRLPS